MNKLVGIAAIVIGIILLTFGINATDSLSSEFSEFFEGSPSNHSIWLMVGGIVAIVAGLGLTFYRRLQHA